MAENNSTPTPARTPLFDPARLANYPTEPGVYLMRNAENEVIYVGKAANLRQRVRNYFTRSGDGRNSVEFLRRHVTEVDVVVTASEKEAFLLENTLIKQHQPRYNIRLRDDKTYISLRIRMNHDFPRLEQVRVRTQAAGAREAARKGRGKSAARREGTTEEVSANEAAGAAAADTAQLRGKARAWDGEVSRSDYYFGPYTSAGAARETMRFLLKIFPLRTCKNSVFRNRTRPCILFDVGKCCGPCTEPVEKSYYRGLIEKTAKFLRGRADDVRESLRERMEEFSERLEFEKAALVRDRLLAIDKTIEKQRATVLGGADRDVIAVASHQGRSQVYLQQYREGTLVHSRDYYMKNYDQEDAEVLTSFIEQHYDAETPGVEIPPDILVSSEPRDAEFLAEWLRMQRGAAVTVAVPQRGERVRVLESALRNARQLLERRLAGERSEEETLAELQRRVGLPRLPRAIECVDISNIMGAMAVGAMVRFEEARPDKSGYRLFKIRTVEGSNDFAMMREVLLRRFQPSDPGRAKPWPDLLLVDGGKGQLGVAEAVFAELGITEEQVMLGAIAKSRLKVRQAHSSAAQLRAGAGFSAPGAQAPGKRLVQKAANRKAALDELKAHLAGEISGYTAPAEGDAADAGAGAASDALEVAALERAEASGPVPEPAIAALAASSEEAAPPVLAGSEDLVRFRTEERIFLPGRKNPITFPPNSPALHLVERVRDETHRTAITYHRKLRQIANRTSLLDEIPGVGPRRKKALLAHFGSLTALKAAELEAISAVEGMSPATAEAVYRALREGVAIVQEERAETYDFDDEGTPESSEEMTDEERMATEPEDE